MTVRIRIPGLRTAMLLGIAAFAAPRGEADIVHLEGGGRVEGDVAEQEDAVIVRTPAASVTIPRARVARIEKAPPLADQLRRRREEAEARERESADRFDAAAHLALGAWCQERLLRAEAAAELLAVLWRDPDHAEAGRRIADLGYERVGREWLPRDEAMRRRGYVPHGGQWVTPAEQRLMALEDETRARLADLRKAPATADAVRASLAPLPFAGKVRPLLGALRDPSREVRAFAVAELSAAGEKAVAPHLVKASLEDADPRVRNAARAGARALDRDSAVRWYTSVAAAGPGATRSRSVQALGEIGGDDVVPGLLVTYYNVILEIRATSARLVPSPSLTSPMPTRVTTPVGPTSVTIETPVLRVERVQTTVVVPAQAEAERNEIVATLRNVTGQKIGDDYAAWERWWKERQGGAPQDPRRAAGDRPDGGRP